MAMTEVAHEVAINPLAPFQDKLGPEAAAIGSDEQQPLSGQADVAAIGPIESAEDTAATAYHHARSYAKDALDAAGISDQRKAEILESADAMAGGDKIAREEFVTAVRQQVKDNVNAGDQNWFDEAVKLMEEQYGITPKQFATLVGGGIGAAAGLGAAIALWRNRLVFQGGKSGDPALKIAVLTTTVMSTVAACTGVMLPGAAGPEHAGLQQLDYHKGTDGYIRSSLPDFPLSEISTLSTDVERAPDMVSLFTALHDHAGDYNVNPDTAKATYMNVQYADLGFNLRFAVLELGIDKSGIDNFVIAYPAAEAGNVTLRLAQWNPKEVSTDGKSTIETLRLLSQDVTGAYHGELLLAIADGVDAKGNPVKYYKLVDPNNRDHVLFLVADGAKGPSESFPQATQGAFKEAKFSSTGGGLLSVVAQSSPTPEPVGPAATATFPATITVGPEASATPTNKPPATPTDAPTAEPSPTTLAVPEYFHGLAPTLNEFTQIKGQEDIKNIIASIRADSAAMSSMFAPDAPSVEVSSWFDGTSLGLFCSHTFVGSECMRPVASVYEENVDGKLNMVITAVKNKDGSVGFLTLYIGGATTDAGVKNLNPEKKLGWFQNVSFIYIFKTVSGAAELGTYPKQLFEQYPNAEILLQQYLDIGIVPTELESTPVTASGINPQK